MRMLMEQPVRVVFMGTPDFAVPSLRALVEHAAPGRVCPGGLDLSGIVTRPDKPAGRGRHVAHAPAKEYALEQGIPVLQPGSLRKPESLALLRSLAPDIIIVAAFGQILPPEVLDLPPHSCLNVHASLLARYRGASPIAAAILAGDPVTGVTIMRMDEGLDTGPIVSQQAVSIAPDDTTGTLTQKLAQAGADLLIATLPDWLAHAIVPEEQDEAQATLTKPLLKEDGRLDWSQSADEIGRRVRAFSPWPGAFTVWNSCQVKILAASPIADESRGRLPGQCFSAVPDRSQPRLLCACGQGVIELEVIQLEGKRPLPAADVLRGHRALADARFDT
jgi:methionyl-tRNA formyltransferase